MRVLVTGASGFIGAYVARHLKRSGHEVIGLVRNGAEPQGVACIRDDLTRIKVLPRVDVIVHAAATSPWPGISPLEVIHDGIFATARLIELASCEKVIFCSSLSLYGDVRDAVLDKNTPIIDPDVYGASKFICERAFAESRFPTIALRLPGVLGVGAHRIWLVNVAKRLNIGAPVTIYSPDAPFNNAAHVYDIANFVEHLLGEKWTGFHAMPLGAASSMTVHKTVERLARAMKVKPNIEIGEAKKPPFSIDSGAARAWGYKPNSLESIIDLFADNFLSEISKAVAA